LGEGRRSKKVTAIVSSTTKIKKNAMLNTTQLSLMGDSAG